MGEQIRPLRIDVPQRALDDLRDLAQRWRHAYDWRAHEEPLNELRQFGTEIDGQDVHFAPSAPPTRTRCRC
jgi:hypothetical protein